MFLIDFLKGWLPVKFALIWGAFASVSPVTAPAALAALCALLGHSFPVWLGFKGGKGIASSAGVVVGLFPQAFLLCIGIWMLVFTLSRYVSVASIAASITLPVAAGVLYALHRTDWLALLVSFVMCLLALWRHRSNLVRLKDGTEPRFERHPKKHKEARKS